MQPVQRVLPRELQAQAAHPLQDHPQREAPRPERVSAFFPPPFFAVAVIEHLTLWTVTVPLVASSRSLTAVPVAPLSACLPQM